MPTHPPNAEPGRRLVPPLTAAVCLCERSAILSAMAVVAADLISAFLDTSATLTFSRAAHLGSVRLLTRLVTMKRGDDCEPLLLTHWLANATRVAAQHGHSALLDHMLTMYFTGEARAHGLEVAALGAAQGGQLRLLQSVVQALGGPLTRCLPYVTDAAALANQLDVLQWIQAQHVVDLPYALIARFAAEKGSVASLQWLHGLETPLPSRMDLAILERALTNGQAPVVAYFIEQRGVEITSLLVKRAAHGGQSGLVAWLVARAPEACTARVLAYVVRHGDVDLARSLVARQPSLWLENGSLSSSPGLLSLAVCSGSVPMLQWVRHYHDQYHGATCGALHVTSGVAEEAARLGALEMLQWLHEQQDASSQFTASVMDEAASKGRLAVVQWLHAHRTEGCSTEAMDGAASFGHLEVVRWLQAHRSEGCTRRAMDGAAWGGHLEVLQFLHAHTTAGCTVDAMNDAAEAGHLEVVLWLHQHRSEGCTTDAMDRAAEHGHVAVVQWLHANRSEGCTAHALDAAFRRGHFALLEWLCAHLDTIGSSSNSRSEVEVDGGKMIRKRTIQAAAEKRQLYALQWLVERWPARMPWRWLNDAVAAKTLPVEVADWVAEASWAYGAGRIG